VNNYLDTLLVHADTAVIGSRLDREFFHFFELFEHEMKLTAFLYMLQAEISFIELFLIPN
jgi:hypothetical protein